MILNQRAKVVEINIPNVKKLLKLILGDLVNNFN